MAAILEILEIWLKPREIVFFVLYMKNNTKISTLYDFSHKKTERYDIVRFSKVTIKFLTLGTGS